MFVGIIPRSILAVPSGIQRQMRQMSFSKLSGMLYRDSVVQKHQDRSRLEKELQDKTIKTSKAIAPSKAKMKAIADIDSAPVVEILLKHILKASWTFWKVLGRGPGHGSVMTRRKYEWLMNDIVESIVMLDDHTDYDNDLCHQPTTISFVSNQGCRG